MECSDGGKGERVREVKNQGREINMENSTFVFECAVVQDEGRYFSLCIDLDVGSEGDTIEEAKKNLQEAVELYLEDSISANLPILRPTPPDENPLLQQFQNVKEKFTLKVKLDLSVYV